MKVSDFELKVISSLREKLGEEYEFNITEVKKVNQSYTGLVIKKKESNIAPTINLDEINESGKTNINEIVNSICEIVYNGIKDNVDLSRFTDWDEIKGDIHIKIINYERNKEILKDTPHIRFLDLAVIFYVDCKRLCGLTDGVILIKSNHLEIWNKNINDLEEAARNRSNEEYIIKNMFEIIDRVLVGLEDIDDSMLVCTNKKGMYGASILYDKQELIEVSNKLQDDFYIIPSSVHEVIVIKRGRIDDTDNIKMIINEVNRSVISPIDYLSDSLYLFDREKEEVMIV